MNRRDWLKTVFGAAVAALVAPLVDLTDQTPAFWNQPPIKKLLPWKVVFPDGTAFEFEADVVAERLLGDGSAELTIQPVGGMKIGRETSFQKRFSSEATATTIHAGTDLIRELQDISLPELDSDEDYVKGIQKRGTFSVTMKPLSEE